MQNEICITALEPGQLKNEKNMCRAWANADRDPRRGRSVAENEKTGVQMDL
jgi:hypothetical protein